LVESQVSADAASGVSGWWPRDLRRTFATGLQRLGVRLEVTEAAAAEGRLTAVKPFSRARSGGRDLQRAFRLPQS
jgi:hypothetical protein